MKLFTYLFVSVLLLGGCYFLFIRDTTPAVATPASTWEAQAQTHLTDLLATQLQAVSSRDWKPFDAALAKADAHLAAAPQGAQSDTFRTALQSYRAQQQMRAQLTTP
jgi:hypothetical protein